MIDIDRRGLIRAGGGLALFAGLSQFPLFGASLGADPFTLGVAAGDPWPDGFVIWTRLAPRPLDEHGGMPAVRVPVRWEVSETENFSSVVASGDVTATPELAHAVHVEVGGLRPYRHYWYRFMVAGSDVSPTGKARTAPAIHELAPRLRIGVAGCQHYEMGFYDAWGHLAAEPDLDLTFHYGDYIYEGAANKLGPRPNAWNVVRQHVGEEIYSLDDYRRRYAQYKSDPFLKTAHAACAFAASFDDHEIDNNWASDFDQDGIDPAIFALRRAVALQAWYEHMPVRKSQFPINGALLAHRRLDFGRLLRLHVLDTRSYRSDQPCGDDAWKNPCPVEAHNGSTVLGDAQEQWLDHGLGSGKATWNLLAQQIIVMPVDFREKGAAQPRYATDLWDGYRLARKRLIDSIQKHQLTNVVIASGDHHRHLVGEVPANEDDVHGAKVAVEFQAASMTSNGNGHGEKGLEHIKENNPHFALYTDLRGYQLFDITPDRWKSDVKIMDQVETPGGKISTMASFVVTPDTPMLHRA